jgi:hypothetical protein
MNEHYQCLIGKNVFFFTNFKKVISVKNVKLESCQNCSQFSKQLSKTEFFEIMISIEKKNAFVFILLLQNLRFGCIFCK